MAPPYARPLSRSASILAPICASLCSCLGLALATWYGRVWACGEARAESRCGGAAGRGPTAQAARASGSSDSRAVVAAITRGANHGPDDVARAGTFRRTIRLVEISAEASW